MFFRLPVLAAAALIILAGADGARATMPPLSPEPSPTTQETCRKWAASQDEEAIWMWGQKEDGSSSREVAVLRLTTSCLGGGRPEIVGFGSSVGFDEDYCSRHPDSGICKPRSSRGFSVKTVGFVFGARGAANSANPAESIGISENIAPSALKRRFSAYKVRIAKGEDCLTCATISGPAGVIDVNYGSDGRTVTGISSRDETSSDVLGNRIGGPLLTAIGRPVAECDDGMEMTCASTIKGLSYAVADDEKCRLEVPGHAHGPTRIPTCAKIGGFQIIR